jgi:hypothetical protein
MSRWSYSDRRTTEECKSISTKWLKDNGYFCGFKWGGMRWTNYAGEETGSISFQVSVEGDMGYIRFQYTQTDRFSKEETHLGYKVDLVSTPCNYGGKRWWFICPLVINGKACNRRVGVLYLGGGKYFGCRHCYNLTYRSCKEHDKRVSALLKNPYALLSMLESKDPKKSLLALKVGFKMKGLL